MESRVKYRAMNNKNLRFLFLLLTIFSAGAYAQLTIEVRGTGSNQSPIAILPLKGEEALPQKLTEIVAADLNRSGYFKIVDSGGINPLPAEPSELQYPIWKARGADAVVIGSVSPQANGGWDVRFRVM